MSEAHAGFIFCGSCGNQNSEKNNFCSKCGGRILRMPVEGADGIACPNCSHVNHSECTVCVRCSHPLPKDVAIREQTDVAVVAILKETVDFENHRDFVAVLNKLIKKRVIIDLSQVNWMDSTGIGMLVTYTYRTTRTKQEVKIVGVNQKIHDAIKSLQVDNVLDIYADVNEALVSWGLPTT